MAESMNNYNGYAGEIEEMDWDEFEEISGYASWADVQADYVGEWS